jgi:hypothetical protein
MNPEQRLQLNELIKANNVADNTEKIRTLKHSDQILADVQKIVSLKQGKAWKEVEDQCRIECPFLYNHYTSLYHRLLRDGLDLTILRTFLSVLKEIEEGKIDQHDASFKIGTLLKQLYVDPKLDEIKPQLQGKPLSWQEFKKKKVSNV